MEQGKPSPDLTCLTQDELRRLFAVLATPRDRALFSLAYHHGLRASEVSLLQRTDINRQQGRMYIPRVKGSIAKTYPLQPEDQRRLRAYERTRTDDSPYLFVSTRHIPLERRSYWDLMQKYGALAGLPKRKRRFHALRHAIAVHLLDAGADVAFVQDRLGHANIQNTLIYRTIRLKAKLLLHRMKSLCYGDPAAFNREALGNQEDHHGVSLACGDNIQTDCVGS